MIIEYDRVIVEFTSTIGQRECWPYRQTDRLFLVRQTTDDSPKAHWVMVGDVLPEFLNYSGLCAERAVLAERGELRIGPKRPLQVKAEEYLKLWRQVVPTPLMDLRTIGLELVVSIVLHRDTVDEKLASAYWLEKHEQIRGMLNSTGVYPLENDRLLWAMRLGSVESIEDAACLRQMVDRGRGDHYDHAVVGATAVDPIPATVHDNQLELVL